MYLLGWLKEKIPDIRCSGKEMTRAWLVLEFFLQKSGWRKFLMLSVLQINHAHQTCTKTYCVSSVGLCSTSWSWYSVKDLFFENLQRALTKISASEILFVCGDFSGHTEMNADVYQRFHGDRGFGRHNLEGEGILEFAVAYNLVVSNYFFTKMESHLVTCQPGKNQIQIDYAWSSNRISS